jgi:SET domain-containing protein
MGFKDRNPNSSENDSSDKEESMNLDLLGGTKKRTSQGKKEKEVCLFFLEIP